MYNKNYRIRYTFGTKVNVHKAKIREIGKTKHKIKFVVEGKSIEQEENFKYQGIMLRNSGDQEKIKTNIVFYYEKSIFA